MPRLPRPVPANIRVAAPRNPQAGFPRQALHRPHKKPFTGSRGPNCPMMCSPRKCSPPSLQRTCSYRAKRGAPRPEPRSIGKKSRAARCSARLMPVDSHTAVGVWLGKRASSFQYAHTFWSLDHFQIHQPVQPQHFSKIKQCDFHLSHEDGEEPAGATTPRQSKASSMSRSVT